MLVEVPYKQGDVVSMKLVSGDEVVARFSEEKDNKYIVSKAMSIMMNPQGIALVPFMFSAPEDSTVEIEKERIICVIKSHEDFAKQYLSQTTGIQIQ